MFRILFLALAVLFTHACFAQKNFTPGYVVKINGDTIKGFVDYRKWNKNPDKINFKPSEDGSILTFSPIQIKEFGVQNEIYVGAIVDAEYSSKKIEQLDDNPDLNLRSDTVFLQTLIRGNKSLYYYKNSMNNDNFYIRWNNDYELLKYKSYLTEIDGQSVMQENRSFVAQLVNYLDGCPGLSSKTRDLKYGKKSLIKLFDYYYECSNSQPLFIKEKDKLAMDFGLLAGVSMSSLKYSSSSYFYLVEADYEMSTSIAGGLFFDFIFPGNQGKWSLTGEMLYTSYNFTGQYEDITSEDIYSITTTEIGYSYLKINVLLRFRYPIGKSFIYANGGLSNGFALSETNYRKRVQYTFGQIRETEGKALDDTRKYEQGFILGIGAKFNHFSLEARFEGSNGMSEYPGLKSAVKRYYFLLGYSF